jgi:hypothetical protein
MLQCWLNFKSSDQTPPKHTEAVAYSRRVLLFRARSTLTLLPITDSLTSAPALGRAPPVIRYPCLREQTGSPLATFSSFSEGGHARARPCCLPGPSSSRCVPGLEEEQSRWPEAKELAAVACQLLHLSAPGSKHGSVKARGPERASERHGLGLARRREADLAAR